MSCRKLDPSLRGAAAASARLLMERRRCNGLARDEKLDADDASQSKQVADTLMVMIEGMSWLRSLKFLECRRDVFS